MGFQDCTGGGHQKLQSVHVHIARIRQQNGRDILPGHYWKQVDLLVAFTQIIRDGP